MKRLLDNEFAVFGVLLFVLLSFVVGAWVTKSYFEARAYNRVTSSNVSTFDAMFIELRVQSDPKD